jgi:hypothetical protein
MGRHGAQGVSVRGLLGRREVALGRHAWGADAEAVARRWRGAGARVVQRWRVQLKRVSVPWFDRVFLKISQLKCTE